MAKKKNESDAFSLEQVSVRLVSAPPLYSDKAISTPEDAVKLLADELQEYDREVVAIINLNGQNVPINFSVLSIGGLNYAVAEPREMLKNMILSNACSAVLLHNHPSGNVTPSNIDIALTDKVVQVCDLVGIPVLDHIIIGNPVTEEVYSFREHDKIPKSKLHFATSVSGIKWTGVSSDVLSDKKYELTDETKVITGEYGQEHTLHRIRALQDFGNVHAGDLGGWVESEKNLSQEGDCWVADEAQIFDNARVADGACVYGNARVADEACVRDNAKVYDYAYVSNTARVCDNALVYGNAHVCGGAQVRNKAQVYDSAQVYNKTEVYGEAQVYGGAEVHDIARVYGKAHVFGDAHVSGEAEVYGNASVYDAAHVSGEAQVFNYVEVYDNAHVCGGAQVYDLARVFGDASVYDNAHVCGGAQVHDNACVCCDAKLTSGEFTQGDIFCTPEKQEEEKVQTQEHKAPARHR